MNPIPHLQIHPIKTEKNDVFSYTVDDNGTPCGRILLHTAEDCCQIDDLTIASVYRGLGGAYLLTEQAAHRARIENKLLIVTLPREAEPARRFFMRFGFVPETCHQEHRYVLPPNAMEPVPTQLDVPFLDQREKYPTGCESVSTIMALRYAGLDISVEDWIDRYLPKGKGPHVENGVWVGANPWKAFPGDPYSPDGWGCFVPVIEAAAKKALENTGYRLKPLYNLPLAALCRLYVARGIPVILWATLDMAEGRPCKSWQKDDGTGIYTWTEPMHCLLLTGFAENTILCNDPMRGKNTVYAWSKAEKAYHTMHTQAAVILPVIQ